MGTKSSRNPKAFVQRLRGLSAGTAKHLGGDEILTVAGATLNKVEIAARLEAPDQLYREVEAARIAVHRALAAYDAAAPAAKLFADNYEAAIKSRLGVTNPRLGEFGIAPARKKRTTGQILLSVARAKQTREANAQAKRARTLAEAVTVAARPPTPGSEE